MKEVFLNFMQTQILQKFDDWYELAKNGCSVTDYTQFTLSTADEAGKPTGRILLLKEHDERGFVFYTNYNGKKSQDLDVNPYASMCFYWPEITKQIRIDGSVEKISPEQSDAYFATRGRGKHIGAWASKQSQEMSSADELQNRIKEFEEKYDGQDVPRPPHWGGWRLIPEKIEFWQEGEFRLHEREIFEKPENGEWVFKRLFP